MIGIERRRPRWPAPGTARVSSEDTTSRIEWRSAMPAIASEVSYLFVVFGLSVVSRMLRRFRAPAPLTSLAFGMAGQQRL
jgi:hypothetical protein